MKEGIWAVGDVTGVAGFTHVSMYQASIAIADILGEAHPRADYRAIPRVTFTDPEIGSVGLSEEAARCARDLGADRHRPDPGHRSGLDPQGRQPGADQARGRRRAQSPRRGAVCGTGRGEVLSLLTLAVHAQVPTEELRSMIYAYPTFHRAIEAAIADLWDDGRP